MKLTNKNNNVIITLLFNDGGTMRQESKGVTEALLESATKEFLKEGFMKASLRKISSESKVSTIQSIPVLKIKKVYLMQLLKKGLKDWLIFI